MTRAGRRRTRVMAMGLAAAALVAVAVAATPSPRFPAYRFDRALLPTEAGGSHPRYDPTGESIFPSVVRVAGRLADPRAAYYLYYAPHDAPGGISLAYADRPEGPWTEYAGNPVIAASWPPHFEVSHVSSPDAVLGADGRLLLYFHGENDATRVASSHDGVTFRYEGVAVSTADLPGATETSYARVAEQAIDGLGNRYFMILMATGTDTPRRLHLAWSMDGLDWTVRPRPLVSGIGGEGRDVSGGTYLAHDGRHLVIYGTSSGDLYAADVGPKFDRERHLGVFYDDAAARAAAPEFLEADGRRYLFYERGPRLNARLALATAAAR